MHNFYSKLFGKKISSAPSAPSVPSVPFSEVVSLFSEALPAVSDGECQTSCSLPSDGIIENQSGTFYITPDGTLTRFIAHNETNPYNRTVAELIIPEGVIRIGTDSLCHLTVTQHIVFPQSLRSIGTELWEGALYHCTLPDVFLPETVEKATSYAFGGCEIRSLYLPQRFIFCGGRYLKHTHIGTLYLPERDIGIPPSVPDCFVSLHDAVKAAMQVNNLEVDRIVYYTENTKPHFE